MSRTFDIDGAPMAVSARPDPATPGRFVVTLGDRRIHLAAHRGEDGHLTLDLPDGRRVRASVSRDGAARWVSAGGATWVVREADPRGSKAGHDGGLEAPMPGKVLVVHVEVGDVVEAGQALVVVEAMKMEHAITAPHAGRVTMVAFQEGAMVSPGMPLVTLDAEDG